MSSSLSLFSVIIEKICQEARDRERSAKNLNTLLSLDQGDCNQIKINSDLLRGKEKGRWALSPQWSLGIREELLRSMERAGRAVHLRV